MRRIYINDVIMQLAEQYVDDLTNNSRKVLNWRKNDMPKNKLNNFLLFLKDSYPVHANYVSKIIELYEDILLLKPSQFQTFHEAHFSEGTQDMLEKRFSYTDSNKQFYSYIIDCMRYDAIRSDLMRQYIKEMHIKTCVYCNAQYAITTEEFIDGDGKKKRMGTYQFDHFMPKSLYPYLCTSFFNLQPSCSTCNINKSKNTSLFNLYTEDKNDVDVFDFKLTPRKAINFYLDTDMSSIEIYLDSNDSHLLENHQNLFHIDLLYAQHIDVVQYIIIKSRTYNTTYMKSLQDSLGVLFPDGTDDPEYFFWGYYMKQEHIHYQPLTKLVQDIVKIISE